MKYKILNFIYPQFIFIRNKTKQFLGNFTFYLAFHTRIVYETGQKYAVKKMYTIVKMKTFVYIHKLIHKGARKRGTYPLDQTHFMISYFLCLFRNFIFSKIDELKVINASY